MIILQFPLTTPTITVSENRFPNTSYEPEIFHRRQDLLDLMISRRGIILRVCLMILSLLLMAARCKPDDSVPILHYFDSNDVEVVAKSIEKYGTYDSDKQRFHANKVRPAFPFDGTEDYEVTSNPYSFGKLIYRDKVQSIQIAASGPMFVEYTANVYLFPGKGDFDYFNKPLIVGDALDPYNERGPWEIYSNRAYKNLLSMDQPFYPRNLGYDIFFVNFNQGAGDILINASLLLELIEWMHTKTSADIIVGGPSMSGIVSRVALLFALPDNHTCESGADCAYLAPNVSGYLSIDSPHQGASLDPKFQCSVRDVWAHLKDGCETAYFFCKDAMCDGVNKAKTGYFQLRTPATYQMLYSHSYSKDNPYQREVCRADATGHNDFYTFIDSLADEGYNPYVPKVAIAYSNFYAPYDDEQAKKAELDENVTYGHIDMKFEDTACEHWNHDPAYNAGGSPLSGEPLNTPGFHELAPGSVGGRFYYSPFEREAVAFYDDENEKTMEMVNYVVAGEIYKGTHIPIYSALDLDLPVDFNWRNLPITDRNELAKYSPFEAIYWMTETYNGYHADQTTNDDKRYEHIIFDDQLMTALAEGLIYLEAAPCVLPNQGDWEIINSCSVLSNHRVPGNIIVKEGVTMTIPEGRTLDMDFVNHLLQIMPGGKVIIKSGGKIY
jgi:hypothetical protein